ncbi:hypothetical protein M8J77_009713 [Diaphorina citri]|nr:hypothetical protein M8J77_009713 [Diaphorina citri]
MTTTDRTLGMIDARHLSKKFLTEFIELYKSLPCLWKIKSKDYVDRNKKNAAYDLMVEKLREVDPEATRDVVTKKINSLRSSYRKERKKVLDSLSDPNTVDVHVPSLWYYELLTSFLADQDNYSLPGSHMDDLFSENAETHTEVVLTEQYTSPPPPPLPTPPPIKRKRIDPIEKATSHPMTYPPSTTAFQQPTTAFQSPEIREAEFHAQAQVWAIELSKMPPSQQLHAKKAINDILYEGQLGNLYRNSVRIEPPPVYASHHQHTEPSQTNEPRQNQVSFATTYQKPDVTNNGNATDVMKIESDIDDY